MSVPPPPPPLQPPAPEKVRPQIVLEKSLKHVLARYADGADYKAFVNDQFKSIRQDLVVQNIKNSFAVAVYEAHARVALEQRDANEFNQSQTQLQELYAAGVPG